MFAPMEIVAVVGVAILIFGADKLPKLARSAGQAKKEFMVGQAEAAAAATSANGVGQPTVVPDPLTGAPGPTTVARPHE